MATITPLMAALQVQLASADFFSDMFFVAMILSGSYILFMLALTFRDNQVVFAVASVVAITLLVNQAFGVMLFLILFFFIIFFGQQFQMLLQFGIYPILGLFGIHPPNPYDPEGAQQMQMEAAEVQEKMLRGEELSEKEHAIAQQLSENMVAQEQQRMQLMNAAARMKR
jgi:energy-coupling factor transporter transmembrane protein EcfT